MAEDSEAGVVVAALTHDLRRKRSVVHLTWINDPEKNVALFVPFGCSLANVREEAEKALRALSTETATLPVTVTDAP